MKTFYKIMSNLEGTASIYRTNNPKDANSFSELLMPCDKINNWLKKNNLKMDNLTPNQLVKRKMEIGL